MRRAANLGTPAGDSDQLYRPIIEAYDATIGCLEYVQLPTLWGIITFVDVIFLGSGYSVPNMVNDAKEPRT